MQQNVAVREVGRPLVDRNVAEVIAKEGHHLSASHRHLQVNGQRSSIMIKKNRVNSQVPGRADPESSRKHPPIERRFAEQKKYHGLRHARYWGWPR